jgi:hypothetical protein
MVHHAYEPGHTVYQNLGEERRNHYQIVTGGVRKNPAAFPRNDPSQDARPAEPFDAVAAICRNFKGTIVIDGSENEINALELFPRAS